MVVTIVQTAQYTQVCITVSSHWNTTMERNQSYLCLLLIGILFIITAVKAEKRERKGSLRWFPAEEKEDCMQVPQQVEVR